MSAGPAASSGWDARAWRKAVLVLPPTTLSAARPRRSRASAPCGLPRSGRRVPRNAFRPVGAGAAAAGDDDAAESGDDADVAGGDDDAVAVGADGLGAARGFCVEFEVALGYTAGEGLWYGHAEEGRETIPANTPRKAKRSFSFGRKPKH